MARGLQVGVRPPWRCHWPAEHCEAQFPIRRAAELGSAREVFFGVTKAICLFPEFIGEMERDGVVPVAGGNELGPKTGDADCHEGG